MPTTPLSGWCVTTATRRPPGEGLSLLTGALRRPRVEEGGDEGGGGVWFGRKIGKSNMVGGGRGAECPPHQLITPLKAEGPEPRGRDLPTLPGFPERWKKSTQRWGMGASSLVGFFHPKMEGGGGGFLPPTPFLEPSRRPGNKEMVGAGADTGGGGLCRNSASGVFFV